MSRDRERGSALLIVFLFAAIVAIMLYTEMPVAVFEARRQKEQLLVGRGEEYAHAVKLYVRNSGRYPASIDQLETTNRIRFLRHRFKDPFTGKDDWRLLHADPNGALVDSKVKNKNPLGVQGTKGGANSGSGSNSGFGSTSSSGLTPAPVLTRASVPIPDSDRASSSNSSFGSSGSFASSSNTPAGSRGPAGPPEGSRRSMEWRPHRADRNEQRRYGATGSGSASHAERAGRAITTGGRTAGEHGGSDARRKCNRTNRTGESVCRKHTAELHAIGTARSHGGSERP